MTPVQFHRAVVGLLVVATAALVGTWIGLALQRAWKSLAISVAWFVLCVTAGVLTRQYADRVGKQQ